MWLGVIFAFTWNKMLTPRRAIISLLICIVISLVMAGIFTMFIADMGLLLELPI
jgi:hypothetical protein